MKHKDSQGHTGEEIIGKLDADALLYCVDREFIIESVHQLKDIIHNGTNQEKISAISTIFKYAISTPTAKIDMTSKGEKITSITVDIIEPNGSKNAGKSVALAN